MSEAFAVATVVCGAALCGLGMVLGHLKSARAALPAHEAKKALDVLEGRVAVLERAKEQAQAQRLAGR